MSLVSLVLLVLLAVLTFDLQMINSNFNLNMKVDLEKLIKVVDEKTSYPVRYRSQNHAGVIITFKPTGSIEVVRRRRKTTHSTVSVVVFGSGKILLTGSRYPDHTREAYEFITAFTDEHHKAFERSEELTVDSLLRQFQENVNVGSRRKRAESEVDSLLRQFQQNVNVGSRRRLGGTQFA